MCNNSTTFNTKEGVTETQVWGVPWSEQQFVEQMVKFGHPMTLRSCLPEVLREAVELYQTMDVHERMAYRANKLGFWLRRLCELKDDEAKLKRSMDADVARILQPKNILLWKDMLSAMQYSDMDVVQSWLGAWRRQGCGRRNSSQPQLALKS